MKLFFYMLLSLWLLFAASLQANDTIDPDSGLIVAPGWEQVAAQCSVCHSVKLVTQFRGDSNRWAYVIDWMIDSQGLWDLSDTRPVILGYLSKNYADTGFNAKDFRRKPLPAIDMPPLPDTQVITD